MHRSCFFAYIVVSFYLGYGDTQDVVIVDGCAEITSYYEAGCPCVYDQVPLTTPLPIPDLCWCGTYANVSEYFKRNALDLLVESSPLISKLVLMDVGFTCTLPPALANRTNLEELVITPPCPSTGLGLDTLDTSLFTGLTSLNTLDFRCNCFTNFSTVDLHVLLDTLGLLHHLNLKDTCLVGDVATNYTALVQTLVDFDNMDNHTCDLSENPGLPALLCPDYVDIYLASIQPPTIPLPGNYIYYHYAGETVMGAVDPDFIVTENAMGSDYNRWRDRGCKDSTVPTLGDSHATFRTQANVRYLVDPLVDANSDGIKFNLTGNIRRAHISNTIPKGDYQDTALTVTF